MRVPWTWLLEFVDLDLEPTPLADRLTMAGLEVETIDEIGRRFELTPAMVAAVKAGAAISIGIDHENYRYAIEPVQPAIRDSLAADLA